MYNKLVKQCSLFDFCNVKIWNQGNTLVSSTLALLFASQIPADKALCLIIGYKMLPQRLQWQNSCVSLREFVWLLQPYRWWRRRHAFVAWSYLLGMPNVNMVPLLLSEDNLFLFPYVCSRSCSVLLLYERVCVLLHAALEMMVLRVTWLCPGKECLSSYMGLGCCMSFLKVYFIQENP